MSTSAPTLNNWLSILALGLIWGGTFMVVAVALEGFGPLTVACARTTLGALAMVTLALLTGRRLPPRETWVFIVTSGALSTAVPFTLLSWAQLYVPSAFVGITMAALPLFVLPLAHLFSDEHMNLRRTLGVSLGFIGALVLIGPSVLALGDGFAAVAQLACLAATLAYATSSILTRRCPPVDPLTLTAGTLVVGAIMLLPVALLVEGVPTWTGDRASYAIIFLGLFPTAVAALLRITVIRSAGSVFMTLVNYQVPLWSVLFGVALLGEVLPLRFFAALGLILTGLVISQWQSLKRLFFRR